MSRVREFDHVIVGGGLAAVSAVDGVLELEPDASIAVLAEESEPPYQRPPLSKEYVQNAEIPRSLLHVKPEGWYEQRGSIDLRRRQRVLVLHPASMSVTTARGDVVRGSRILMATGGRARRLDVPGANLPGVLGLRTLEDAEAIRNAAAAGERAVLVGAGFVGMELAASLTFHGVRSVVLEAETQIWPHVLPPELAPWMQSTFEERGVTFRLGSRVEAFEGDGRVEAVRADGQELAADFAVVGVGMDPCDGLAADAGLAVGDGVFVDAFGETSHPNIYAAGDVARFPDPVFGGHTRVGHWEHAREHGRLVGRNMAGAKEPYRLLSYFFSRVFDLSLDVVGRPREVEETVLWGDPGIGPCFALGSTRGRLTAVVMLNAPRYLEPARTLVRAGPPIADVLRTLDRSEETLGELAEGYRKNRPPWPAPKPESE